MAELLQQSYKFGRAHLDAIVDSEVQSRGVSRELAYEYLSRYIRFEFGREEFKGMQAFCELARLPYSVPV